MVNGEKEEAVGETPTGATGTVALPGKSLMIGVLKLASGVNQPKHRRAKAGQPF